MPARDRRLHIDLREAETFWGGLGHDFSDGLALLTSRRLVRICWMTIIDMVDEIDIWRAATILVDEFGEEAVGRAAARALELKGNGDVEGEEVWGRVMDAILELRRTIRRPEEPTH